MSDIDKIVRKTCSDIKKKCQKIVRLRQSWGKVMEMAWPCEVSGARQEVQGSVYTAFLTATHEIRQPAVVSGSASKRARG